MKKYFLLVLSSLVVLLASYATTAQDKKIEFAPAFTGNELRSLPHDGWVTNGGNIYNQRFSPLRQINGTTFTN